jgi:hypothetical protein
VTVFVKIAVILSKQNLIIARMQKILHKPFIVFAILSSVLALLFFLVPINLFDGEIVVDRGLQHFTLEQRLSLSNFIGIGTEGFEEQGIVDFYLNMKGILIACILILGMPAILAYRLYLKVTSGNEDTVDQ